MSDSITIGDVMASIRKFQDEMRAKPASTGPVEIFESEQMTDDVEDWSRVRSPSRARRRRAQGHPQNIVYRKVPKEELFRIDGRAMGRNGWVLVGHPVTVAKFRRAANASPSPLNDGGA